MRPIPEDFVLGVATSSWQIEGDVAGRGPSTWDEFATRPGAIVDGATGEPACDHVHRLEEDLELLAWLGVDSYRFSISWPRAMDGDRLRPEGIAFYDRLVDGLLERGIAPAATLFHWDTPLGLEQAGGWPDRRMAEAFADYAEAMARRLGDRVERWLTLNEPWCSAFLGYSAGYFAPGIRDQGASLAAAYHLMLGHGLAVTRMRDAGARNIGITLNVTPMIAETPEMDAITHHMDGIQNRIFLDPVAGRGIPADLVESCGHLTDWAFMREDDVAIMGAPIDWIGENYYTVMRIAPAGFAGASPDLVGQDISMFPGTPPMSFAPRPPVTDMGWEVIPEGIVMACRQVAEAVPGVPIFVTENGAAVPEVTRPDGSIDDAWRQEYIGAHIDALLGAREQGLDIRGYYAWSLLDNLEWASGWTKKFGIVRVDPATGERTPKGSAHWYRDLLASRGSQRPRLITER